MKTLLGLVLLAACNNGDATRVAQLEAALKDCRAQSAQGNPSAPSGIVAPRTEAVESALPTTITLGGRTYEILPILRDKEEFVKGDTMVARAKEDNAHLGREDGEHLLAHQDDIPAALRGKVVFVFTNWPRPGNPGNVYYVYWNGDRWVEDWDWLDDDWDGSYRVLRRKS